MTMLPMESRLYSGHRVLGGQHENGVATVLGGILGLVIVSGSFAAEEGGIQGRPPWMQPQVVKAGLQSR
ncbi:MAG: hypothetical protein Ct9H300mP8_08790 [Gammaproteobacteria bacterium]|nr:MAG: hypothetical protein Ct9H300mP8_08790 [Gammaproteobacteria bacterium]